MLKKIFWARPQGGEAYYLENHLCRRCRRQRQSSVDRLLHRGDLLYLLDQLGGERSLGLEGQGSSQFLDCLTVPPLVRGGEGAHRSGTPSKGLKPIRNVHRCRQTVQTGEDLGKLLTDGLERLVESAVGPANLLRGVEASRGLHLGAPGQCLLHLCRGLDKNVSSDSNLYGRHTFDQRLCVHLVRRPEMGQQVLQLSGQLPPTCCD